MKETILLYNFNDKKRLSKLTKALLPMKFRIKNIKREQYLQPIGYLAGIKDINSVEDIFNDDGFNDEMIVMAGLNNNRIDELIYTLKKCGVGKIDYKAVLTSTNQYWNSLKLYEEIKKEHESLN